LHTGGQHEEETDRERHHPEPGNLHFRSHDVNLEINIHGRLHEYTPAGSGFHPVNGGEVDPFCKVKLSRCYPNNKL